MIPLFLKFALLAQTITASFNIINVNNLNVYDAYSCELPSTPSNKGFDVDFYDYSSGDNKDFINAEYVAYGYTQSTYFGSSSGITNPSSNLAEILKTDFIPVDGVYAQKDLTITNFTAQFTGYFYADTTGYYDFALNNIDDAVMLFMGTEAAFECCTTEIDKAEAVASNAYQVYAYLQWHVDGTPSASYKQFLEAGKYYPVRIIYINVEGSLALNLAVTLPSGKVVLDFSDYVFSAKEFKGKGSCKGDTISSSISHHTTTEFIHWTSTVSSATTETNTVSWGTNTVLDYVPDYTTTTTDVWTGSSTSVKTMFPSNNDNDDTITVEVFTPRATDTSTISWTGSYTSTSTTVVPTNAHMHATVEIEIPDTTSQKTLAAAHTSAVDVAENKKISIPITSTTSSTTGSVSSVRSTSLIEPTSSTKTISSTISLANSTPIEVKSTGSIISASSTTFSSYTVSFANSTTIETKSTLSTNFIGSTTSTISAAQNKLETLTNSSLSQSATSSISTNLSTIADQEGTVIASINTVVVTTSLYTSSSIVQSKIHTLATQIKQAAIASATPVAETQTAGSSPSQTSDAVYSSSSETQTHSVQISNSGNKLNVKFLLLTGLSIIAPYFFI